MAEVYYPVGKYQCRITQQGFDTTSTGKPQFVLGFTVIASENGEPVPQKERAYYKVLTERTMEYFVKDMQALGVDATSLRMLDPNTPGHIDMVGREVLMYVKHGTDQNGNDKEEWSPAYARRDFAPPPANELSRLDLLFGRAMKSTGATPQPRQAAPPAAPKPAPAPVAAGAFPSDNDVPF